jgi:hypothetical protein
VNTRSRPRRPNEWFAWPVKPAAFPRPVRRPTRRLRSRPMQPRVTVRVSSEQVSRPCREGLFPKLHTIQHRPRSVRRLSRSRKRRPSRRCIHGFDQRAKVDSINRSVTSPRHHRLAAQEGRAPDQAGSASHSAHRIRRSSSPTPDENKRRVIAACLGANEHCRNAGYVPDDCCVCHSVFGPSANDSRRGDHEPEKQRHYDWRNKPLSKVEFADAGHMTAFLDEAGAQCSQSPITAQGAAVIPRM